MNGKRPFEERIFVSGKSSQQHMRLFRHSSFEIEDGFTDPKVLRISARWLSCIGENTRATAGPKLARTEMARYSVRVKHDLSLRGESMPRLAITLGLVLLSCCVLVASAGAQTSKQQTTLTAEQYTQEGNAYAKEKQYDKAV